jgi:hypothetical protein
VLRNYEQYPDFGHDIDLVVRWSDLPRWKQLAMACAVDHGWAVLAECGHWARSSSRIHNIQILRFYSQHPPQYLQVDAFHSFLVLGLPLFDEDTLLSERIWDGRGFYRIDEGVENFYRLLQIAKLAGMKGAGEKLKKYSARVLSHWKSAPALAASAGKIGFPGLPAAMDHLRSGDFQRFKRQIDRQKSVWWINQVMSHPFRAARMIFNRFLDLLRLFWLSPCGFTVCAFAGDEAQRKRLEKVLTLLIDTNIITHFTLSRNVGERQKVRERGGVVIEWVSEKGADLVVDQQADDQSVIGTLLNLIIDRHFRILDQRMKSN